MARFNPELYLRLLGEQQLVASSSQRRWETPLTSAAAALVAVGAMRHSRAEGVLSDYSLAEGLREEHGTHFHLAIASRSRRRRRPKPARATRIVPCHVTLDKGQLTTFVSYAALSSEHTELAVTIRSPVSGPSSKLHGMHYGPFPGSSGMPQATLTDDRGTTTVTHFSGSGSDSEWEGHLTAEKPLSPDTAWIEIDGERVQLDGTLWPTEIELEPLPERAPAHRHIWHLLAGADHFHGPDERSLELAVDALVAAGALSPEDPIIAEVRAVAEALPHLPHMHGGGSPAPLPEPWRSLLRRRTGPGAGPEVNLVIGAVVPPFDDHRVVIPVLRSHREQFSIQVDVSPGPDHAPAGMRRLGQQGLEWWAQDDRGNPYLGHFGSWSGSDERAQGQIEFAPGLPAKTRWVRIMPTGPTTRAVITVRLPPPAGASEVAA